MLDLNGFWAGKGGGPFGRFWTSFWSWASWVIWVRWVLVTIGFNPDSPYDSVNVYRVCVKRKGFIRTIGINPYRNAVFYSVLR